MSKAEKLKAKLQDGTIGAKELRKLFGQLGVEHMGQRGSHEKYSYQGRVFILATHSKDLLEYQIKQARIFLGVK